MNSALSEVLLFFVAAATFFVLASIVSTPFAYVSDCLTRAWAPGGVASRLRLGRAAHDEVRLLVSVRSKIFATLVPAAQARTSLIT